MAQPWSDGKIHGYYNVRGDLVLVNEGEEAPPGPGWTEVSWPAGETPDTGLPREYATFSYYFMATQSGSVWRINASVIPPEGWTIVHAGWYLNDAHQASDYNIIEYEVTGRRALLVAEGLTLKDGEVKGLMVREMAYVGTYEYIQGAWTFTPTT